MEYLGQLIALKIKELFFYVVSSTLFKGSLTLLLLYFALRFFLKRRETKYYKDYHIKELQELGFWGERKRTVRENGQEKYVIDYIYEPILKWSKNKEFLRIIKANPNITKGWLEDPSNKEKLEQLFKCQFLQTKPVDTGKDQMELRVYRSNLPSVLEMSEMPSDIVASIWWGRDGYNKDVVTRVKDVSSILILAMRGSGKSILIRSCISTLTKSIEKIERYKKYKVIIVDNKGTDFLSFKKSHDAKIFNPSDIRELREVVQIYRDYIKELDNFRQKLKELEISVEHWFDLIDYPTPILGVFDEMIQYFGKSLGLKKPKEGAPVDEHEAYEHQELCKELARYVEKINALYRISGAVTICSSQISNSSEYKVNFTNFTLKIIGRQSTHQSRALCGSNIATSHTLRHGRFIYLENEPVFIQAPYEKLPKIELTDHQIHGLKSHIRNYENEEEGEHL